MTTKSTTRDRPSHILDAAVRQFEKSPTAYTAAEVADAVSLLGHDDRASAALRYLQERRDALMPMVTERFTQAVKQHSHPASPTELRGAIAQKRKSLIDQPRNSIGHVEIARLYAVAGQAKAADRHMEMAVKISPDSRFVLRSAARLFVHYDRPEKALYFLQRSNSIKHDPWLMAAEVAVADSFGERQEFGIRQLKRISGLEHASINYSELASALGALEDRNGAHKIARKLIRRSLDHPTENSLAQAVWMSTKAKHQFVDLNLNPSEQAYEAGVFQAIHMKEYQRADRFAWNWLNDEPFSSGPAVQGSFINCTFTRSYSRALAFCERGLISNPDDDTLQNNRIFSLIMCGRLDEAQKILPVQGKLVHDPQRPIFDLALHGLWHFKSGNFSEGRRFYREAAERALPKYPNLYASAISHWLENEVVSGSVDRAEFEQLSFQLEDRLKKLKADLTIWSATRDFLQLQYSAPTQVRTIVNPRTGEEIRFIIR
ncbi:hypothetical protein [Rhizobium sp. RU20A]|uniref:tetratricopeptide repeat protein n=1 Tax=Rhizobium sp. RU20A TaxID=1907412 RepID=UPI00122D34AC|nr:hypothetical protein [Rhizobium sp. RU20A]